MAAWEQALHSYHQPWRKCPALQINVVPPLFDEIMAAITTHLATQRFAKTDLKIAAEHGRLRAFTKGYGAQNLRQEYAFLLAAIEAMLEQDTALITSERAILRAAIFRAQRRALDRYNHVHHARRTLRKMGGRIKLASTKRDRYATSASREAFLFKQVKQLRRMLGLMQTHALSGNANIPWEQIYQIVDHIPHPVFTVDADGSVNFINARWYHYTGLTPAQSLDYGWTAALPPQSRQTIANQFANFCKTGKDCEFECEFRDAQGHYRWHHVRMWSIDIPTDRKTPIVWLAMAHDIHDEKLSTKSALEEIGRAHAAYAQAQANVTSLEHKAAMRERFVALLGHDLRNPLTVAQTCCIRLLRQPDRPAPQREQLVQRIVTALDRTDSMIGNLLDAYRLQQGNKVPIYPEATCLRRIVASCIEHLIDEQSARFELRADAPTIAGTWDVVNLGRVFDNLCTNAIKYGAPDTPIVITLSGTEHEVLATIHNQGEPIPQAFQDKIFSPFERAQFENQQLAGWGLGLVLVRGIVEAHHGQVWVESTKEAGTSFFVRLPRHTDVPNNALLQYAQTSNYP